MSSFQIDQLRRFKTQQLMQRNSRNLEEKLLLTSIKDSQFPVHVSNKVTILYKKTHFSHSFHVFNTSPITLDYMYYYPLHVHCTTVQCDICLSCWIIIIHVYLLLLDSYIEQSSKGWPFALAHGEGNFLALNLAIFTILPFKTIPNQTMSDVWSLFSFLSHLFATCTYAPMKTSYRRMISWSLHDLCIFSCQWKPDHAKHVWTIIVAREKKCYWKLSTRAFL